MDYTDSFGFQWNIHAKTQLDSYTGISNSRERLFDSTGWPEKMPGEKILEAGSGAGRFTEILLTTGADVWSFDDSEAVSANKANNGGHPNLHLFRANIYDLELPPGSFDRVVCLGVLQHTPDPKAAFMSLARQVRPGGRLAIDVYALRITGLLHWKYVLRPITKRMDKKRLYRVVQSTVPHLLPLAVLMRKIGGIAGARLIPVCEYSNLGLTPERHVEWSILDTFDALSPRHDRPQRMSVVRSWFDEAGFDEVVVRRGFNGIVGTGRKL